MLFWSDTFAGGTTVGGWAPPLWGSGSGSFVIDIPAGSTIHQAYLFATSHEDLTADFTVTLNGTDITITPADMVVTFPDPTYTGNASICAIDVTAMIDPLVSNYDIDAIVNGTFMYQDYMLFVAFENNVLSEVSSYVYLNNQGLAPDAISWQDVESLVPLPESVDICASFWIDYACDSSSDSQWIDINGTLIGQMGGGDSNGGACAGVLGNYTYSNGVTTALGPDDTADAFVGGADGLINLNSYVTPGESTMEINVYDGPDFVGFDNAFWAAIITYGSTCEGNTFTAGGDTTICPGQSTILEATGGIEYEWTPALGLDDASISNPTASPMETTTYEVMITFESGCVLTGEVMVTVNGEAINIASNIINALCAGTGSISVELSGGVEPYEIFLGGVLQSSSTMEGLAPGFYNIEVNDADGCTVTTVIEVEQTDDPVLFDIAVTEALCLTNGSLEITQFNNGNAPYTVLLDGVVQKDLVFEELPEGEYTIEVTDGGGCMGEIIMEVGLDNPTLSFDLDITQAICETPGMIDVENVSGGTPSYTYSLDGEVEEDDVFEELAADEYLVTVTDTNGCTGSLLAEVPIIFPGNADFVASPFEGPNPLAVSFFNSSSYFAEFLWDFGTGDSSSVENPSYIYYLPGEYPVTLYGFDNVNGCLDTLTWIITVKLPNSIYIPNSFTPDGDGINEVFTVKGEGLDAKHFELKIFDRWGEVIFLTQDISMPWLGDVHEGEYFVQAGVYLYTINYRFIDSVDEHKIQGHVTVVR